MVEKSETNLPDWSALVPVVPGKGPRAPALYAAIRLLIESGAVPPGGKLPPTRALSSRLGLSRAAVVTAFEMLIADGFAEARVGAGTYVSQDVPRVRKAEEITPPVKPPVKPLPGTLGSAEPDHRTLQIFRTFLSRHLARPGPEHFYYGDPQGGVALREAVAAYLRSARGVRCTAASVIITSGTQQALDLVVRAAFQPGEALWMEDPGYPMARAAFEGAGMVLTGVPVDAEGLDVAAGEAVMPGARGVYVTPSHQFPLGVTMSMRRRLALIDWARRNGAWIIEDDYDSEFRYAGPPLTALQGIDASGRVIYTGTFSKVLFPGLRLGYAVVPAPLMERVVALKNRTDRQAQTLVEAALADLLRLGHFAAHLRRARRRMEVARNALVEGLRSSGRDLLDISVPDQGLHLIARLPNGIPAMRWNEAARTAGLAVRDLSAMYIGRKPENGLVIGFSGFPAEELRSAAARFAAGL